MARLLITGASGFIGGHVAVGARDGWEVVGAYGSRRPVLAGVRLVAMNLAEPDSIAPLIDEIAPDAVIHCAAISDIDFCERERVIARAVNTDATATIAAACAERGTRLVAISSDNVFDGATGNYREDVPPNPVNWYGWTKTWAEVQIHRRDPHALIVRIPLTFGFSNSGARSHLGGVMETIRTGRPLWFIRDEYRSPIDVHTLAAALVELAGRPVEGTLHVAGLERISRADFGRELLRRLGLPEDRAEYRDAVPGRAPRPADVSLDATKASLMLNTPLPDFAAMLDRIWAESPPEMLSFDGAAR